MISSARPASTGLSGRMRAAVPVCVLALGTMAPVHAAELTLTETGSSLIYPLFKVWADEYAKTHPGVAVDANSTDSGAGIEKAVSGAVQIGASDAYMSDDEIKRNPQIVNVALAISAQSINTNIPGLNDQTLKLNGPALAGIYTGKIRQWDDPAIASLNPGVKLPHNDIAPIHRSDPSGDTFVFTQYLTFSTERWENRIGFVSPESWEKRLGYGVTVAWPAVPGALEATGNTDVVAKLRETPYSIGYVGVSFHQEIEKAGLGTAAVQSYDGAFLLPTADSIAAAARALWPRTPADERLTLVNAPGANAYPLVNYEYAIVSTRQSDPKVAEALRRFLLWSIAPDETNEKYLADAHFVPLPAHVWVLSHDQIERIR
ncbi:phosphate ABC transporter substrate-binding protein (PhoT family) [Roseiarcus fermentans]|uniref:Phosphate-binding protein PstS n=1 Tax=Roseiarcus fermentans TaxID=1473586 RepID=A0A366EV72_9HYPH|nr:phosphate ABC transporter substrate-binding protein PstS [Roseiarcus fermentans]RBP06234.1 phosphate ABC transporter substrate-binding protein (PhoT family) [Roseiarcus fermentans]